MIVDTTMYDLSMTLIIAKVTNTDEIVFSSDSMALKEDGTIFSDSVEKIFKLADKIYWAAAGEGIYPDDLKLANLYLAEHICNALNSTETYSMDTVAIMFGAGMRRVFEVNTRDNLLLDCVLVGFSKNQSGYFKPEVYSISSRNNFMPEVSVQGLLVGDIDKSFKESWEGMSRNYDTLAAEEQQLIEEVSNKIPSVGGAVTTVIIGDSMSKKLFKRLIKSASQPAPKEEGQSAKNDSYSGKQTRSRKTADTSAKRSDTSPK